MRKQSKKFLSDFNSKQNMIYFQFFFKDIYIFSKFELNNNQLNKLEFCCIFTNYIKKRQKEMVL